MFLEMEFNNTDNGLDSSLDPSVKVHNSCVVVSYMALIALFAIPGNILIIIVQLRTKTKSSIDYYIFSIAVFDFISGLFVAPMFMFQYTELTWIAVRSSPFCRIRAALLFLTTCASTLLLGAVAIDRYLLTCRIEDAVNFKLKYRAKATGVIIALVSLAFSSVNLFITGYDDSSDKCGYRDKYKSFSLVASCVLMVVFMCVFIVIVGSYMRVSFVLRRRHKAAVARSMNQFELTPCAAESQCLSSLGNCVPRPISTIYLDKDPKRDIESGIGSSLNLQYAQISLEEPALTPTQFKQNRVTPSCVHLHQMAKISRDEKVINRTTLMLFLISAVYITSWVISWTMSIAKMFFTDDLSENIHGLITTSQMFFLINVPINPMFYMIMSTKFRQNVLILLRLKRRVLR